MDQKRGVGFLIECCRRKNLNRALEKYIKSCREYGCDEDACESKARKKRSGRFPNIAGFCGYYRLSIDDLEKLSSEFPDELAYIYAIFEDEALNSGLPPAVLSAYLKKRLGYEKESSSGASATEQMSIRFEHDIYGDGE